MLEQEQQFKAISIDTFKNVATHKMRLLSRLDLATVHDLIFNLPYRYEDHTYVQPLCDLFDEQVVLNTPCNVIFTVVSNEPEFTKKATNFLAQDISGTPFILTYFNCPEFIINQLLSHEWFIAYGVVSYNTYSESLTMIHPEVTPLGTNEFDMPQQLSPIYHLTKGISQEFIRRLEERALSLLVNHPLDELLPSALNPFKLTLTEALLITHNPPPSFRHTGIILESLTSFKRICFEELVAFRLAMAFLHDHQNTNQTFFIPYNKETHEAFLNTLPFKPTGAQTRTFYEIMYDCAKEQPMSRIVNGDVGSGKTLVAALCMLQCAQAGLQTVMLAPTEILAVQHHQKLSQFFKPMGFEVGLLTGSLKRKEKSELLKKCASGQIKVVVGTHALFQSAVKYQNLALVIVDEQHRFGVNEREMLLNKAPVGYAAHELLMTATPIPRSLRLALFQDTAVSVLNELPAGRQPVQTSMVEFSQFDQLISRLRAACNQGDQAFWICPYVDETENGENEEVGVRKPISVKRRFKELQEIMPEIKIGLLHGKMNEKEKNEVMSDFLAQRYQILVATVIVEVGVDVPNASIIIIEEPNLMGLSQLHQLRGRVGRGVKQSFCILLYHTIEKKQVSQHRRRKKAVSTDVSRSAGVGITQNELLDEFDYDIDDTPSNAELMYGESALAINELEQELSTAGQYQLSQHDMMDWQSDSELTAQMQNILQSDEPISIKRMQILRCTNNGFAIASQDLVLRGPGEVFGSNQSGNENFRFADIIRDYRMLQRVNQTAIELHQHDKKLARALVDRWYPNFAQVEQKKIEDNALRAQIASMEIDEDHLDSANKLDAHAKATLNDSDELSNSQEIQDNSRDYTDFIKT